MEWTSKVSVGKKEMAIVCRSLFIMMVSVIIGLIAAETQINSLTRQRESVEVLNIKRQFSQEQYALCIVGNYYNFGGLFFLGKIESYPSTIVWKKDGKQVAIPTYIGVDCEKEFVLAHQKAHSYFQEILEMKSQVQKEIQMTLYR